MKIEDRKWLTEEHMSRLSEYLKHTPTSKYQEVSWLIDEVRTRRLDAAKEPRQQVADAVGAVLAQDSSTIDKNRELLAMLELINNTVESIECLDPIDDGYDSSDCDPKDSSE